MERTAQGKLGPKRSRSGPQQHERSGTEGSWSEAKANGRNEVKSTGDSLLEERPAGRRRRQLAEEAVCEMQASGLLMVSRGRV